jgi:hypothetical protein
MLAKIPFALRPVVAIALAGSMTAAAVAAPPSDKPRVVAAHHPASAVRHWRHFARSTPPVYGYVSAPHAFYGPGYVFVPGRGILDEACDLPTSTCPNTDRDTQ